MQEVMQQQQETQQEQLTTDAIDQIDYSKLSVEERRQLMRLLGSGAREVELHNRAVRQKIKNRKLNVRQKASRKANRAK